MNRNNGLFAGMLVVLTYLGVSNIPNKSAESPPAEARGTKSVAVKTTPASHPSAPSSPCVEIAKRLRRFVKSPAAAVDLWQLPDSCYEPGGTKGKISPVETVSGLSFAIATAPDPISTHLPLMFDRVVEAAQQAAQDNNYTYDSSWFPWEASEKEYPLLDDQQRVEERQDIKQSQPGVMVFRRALHASKEPYGGGLVIFLVGEQPTGGLRDEQFESALDWIGKLGGLKEDMNLRILGPTFSGSLPSLQRALGRYFEDHKKGPSRVFVSSGTVSSETGPEWFGTWIQTQRPGSYFRTAMESDSVMVNRFCQYMDKQGYHPDRIALLSEDETAFGRGTHNPKNVPENPDAPCAGAIDLYYPRDIATLRSAYQQQAVLTSGKPPSDNKTPSTTLRGDLSEPANANHDTVRTYGGQLTPLAQEAILLNIVNRLREKETQFILIRSTNSLDQIFLSEFLRRSFPQGRVVIDGADLLFNRGTEGRSLRGVMMLSPYPLLMEEQDWTSSLMMPRNGGYRSFGEDAAEAVYIAARELLLDPILGTEVPMRDLAPPAWAIRPYDDPKESQRPATWIGVVGRRQFWPVAVLNSSTMEDSRFSGKLPPWPDREDDVGSAGDDRPLHFPTPMWMFLIACCGWSGCYVYFCRNGSIMGSPRPRAYFAPIDREQHAVLIALGSVLLAMLAVTTATASGLFSLVAGPNPFRQPVAVAWLAAGLVLVTFAAAPAAYALNCMIPASCASSSPANNTKLWRVFVAIVASVCLLAYSAMQASLLFGLSRANRIPAYWRSINLLSGVSPLLPELLLLFGGYLWFWCSLRGLAHFGDDRPVLPKLADLPMADDGHSRMPMFSREKAGDPVENEALPINKRYLSWMLTIFTVTAVVSAIGLRDFSIRTLGEQRFGTLIFFWICLSVAAILADGVQTWLVWNELRKLLVFLDRLPLRRTLRSLKGIAWGSIWKMSGNGLDERYRVISLQIESLRHLKNTLSEWEPADHQDAAHKDRMMSKISDCFGKLQCFAKWYLKLDKDKPVTHVMELRDFQEELASTAGTVMTHILLPAWEKEKVSLIFGRSSVDTKGESGKSDDEIPTDGLLPHVRTAEEFFVLPYLAFIQNTLGRLRTIAMGTLWLFVGATLAVSSYPFDPLDVLGGLFLATFVGVAGVTILVYSQMCRDATLSHITNTKPGELGVDFWVRLVGFGIGPLIGLLTTLFPSITDFALSWLQPSVAALK